MQDKARNDLEDGEPNAAAPPYVSARSSRSVPDRPLYDIPPGGSLGLLAAGWRGVRAWREVRGPVLEDEPKPDSSPGLEDVSLVIVTGLPRSGTSMVMQMLEAADVAPFTDDERTADPDNPRGYLEAERVKRLAYDSSWLGQADGHALKVVAPLLPHLPTGPHYRAVLIERDLEEVLRSQAAMLDRHGETAAAHDALRSAYARYLEAAHAWLDRHADAITLHHRDVIANPLEAARSLHAHLDLEGDPSRTAAVIDASLHRQRADA
ncbi:MAG: hypothetical protein WBA11_00420 [Rubrivirga sp.]